MFIRKVDGSLNPEKYFDTVPLYQGLFFRQWQERFGRNVLTLVMDESEKKVTVYIQCVEYVLPVVGSVWVATQGPLGSFSSVVGEESFYAELRSLCTEVSPKISHIRFQKKPISPQVRVAKAELEYGTFMQPFAEQVISLTGEFADIVDNFSVSTSRLVRQYEEGKCEGVRFQVEKEKFTEHLKVVYALFVESEKSVPSRESFLRPYAYYMSLFEELDAHPERGMLVLGYVEGQESPVSFALTVFTDSEAYHVFSGTSSDGHACDVATLVLYTVLKEAKEQGAKRYIIGDTDAVSSDDLSVLQEEFGGKESKNTVLHDVVVSGWRYYLFRFLRLHRILAVRRLLTRLYAAIQVELTTEE